MLKISSQVVLLSVVLFYVILNFSAVSRAQENDEENESDIIFEYPPQSIHHRIKGITRSISSKKGDKLQECLNENIAPGKCVEIINCPPALQSVRIMKKHNFKRCGFHGIIEVICCPDKYIDTNESSSSSSSTTRKIKPLWPSSSTTTTDSYSSNIDGSSENNERENENGNNNDNKDTNFNEREQEPKLNTRKYAQVCDEYSNEIKPDVSFHIIEGEDAEPKEYPHMVALGYNSDTIGVIKWGCGGSLISSNYVLTAAHCIINADQNPPVKARMGTIKLEGTNPGKEGNVQDFDIVNITVHPEYKRWEKWNDIALLKLNKKVKYDEFVHPACLYDQNDDPVGLTVTGWGNTDIVGENSNILQKAKLTAVPLQECNSTYLSRTSKNVLRSQICAADNTSDTCQGDSGGPLQVQNIANSSVYSIVGVTSYGIGCGGGKYPGIYTRVSSYLDWIEKIVWGV